MFALVDYLCSLRNMLWALELTVIPLLLKPGCSSELPGVETADAQIIHVKVYLVFYLSKLFICIFVSLLQNFF